MAEKLAVMYRFVTKDKEGNPVRVVLRPGDDAKDLPKDVRDDLKKRGSIVDERRLTEDGLRIPPGTEDREPAQPAQAAQEQVEQAKEAKGEKDKK